MNPVPPRILAPQGPGQALLPRGEHASPLPPHGDGLRVLWLCPQTQSHLSGHLSRGVRKAPGLWEQRGLSSMMRKPSREHLRGLGARGTVGSEKGVLSTSSGAWEEGLAQPSEMPDREGQVLCGSTSTRPREESGSWGQRAEPCPPGTGWALVPDGHRVSVWEGDSPGGGGGGGAQPRECSVPLCRRPAHGGDGRVHAACALLQ